MWSWPPQCELNVCIFVYVLQDKMLEYLIFYSLFLTTNLYVCFLYLVNKLYFWLWFIQHFCFDSVCHIVFCTIHIITVMDFFSFLFVCFYRSLTSNLPNVNLPNVNLQIPKVPNLPASLPVSGLSVNLPQMPSFSTPSWMAAIYDSECVFNKFT